MGAIKDNILFKVGARESRLSKIQSGDALAKIEALIDGVTFEKVFFASPGDRDRKLDLRESPEDFFTRDLDDAVLSGEIDCAVHSAKDVPFPVREGLDWLWLPWQEDRRDVLVMAPGKTVSDLPARPRMGVSSDRREEYTRQRFPDARMEPIRGNVPARVQQVDDGSFDIMITAAAAMHRLGMADRITEYISLTELPSPQTQGILAMTFKSGNPRLEILRRLFVKQAVFVGAGAGNKGLCTLAGLEAIRSADVCLYDTLMPMALIDELGPQAEAVDVGKRCGKHSKDQTEINALIADYVRQGKRVVRLKGGDAGIFGRLAEEIETLEELGLPYRVVPGISSMNAATTGTGMLATRRGVSRGFTVMTPRKKGGGVGAIDSKARGELPVVFFMSLTVVKDVIATMLDDGTPADMPAAFVFNAGSDQQHIVRGQLKSITAEVPEELLKQPGLFIVGRIAAYRFDPELGALQGRRILLTCSRALESRAVQIVRDLGGMPVYRPLVDLVPVRENIGAISALKEYDWLVLTSPSAVRCFFALLPEAGIDIRHIPPVISCGTGTSRELRARGLFADAEPPRESYSAEGVLATAQKTCQSGARILRMRSNKAGPALSEGLRESGFKVDDVIICNNEPLAYEEDQPEFDAGFFASSSSVEFYEKQWGIAGLKSKIVCAIGQPTALALEQRGIQVDLIGAEATVESSMTGLAAYYISKLLKDM